MHDKRRYSQWNIHEIQHKLKGSGDGKHPRMVKVLVLATVVEKLVAVAVTVEVDEKRTVILTSWPSPTLKKGLAARDLQTVSKLLIWTSAIPAVLSIEGITSTGAGVVVLLWDGSWIETTALSRRLWSTSVISILLKNKQCLEIKTKFHFFQWIYEIGSVGPISSSSSVLLEWMIGSSVTLLRFRQLVKEVPVVAQLLVIETGRVVVIVLVTVPTIVWGTTRNRASPFSAA